MNSLLLFQLYILLLIWILWIEVHEFKELQVLHSIIYSTWTCVCLLDQTHSGSMIRLQAFNYAGGIARYAACICFICKANSDFDSWWYLSSCTRACMQFKKYSNNDRPPWLLSMPCGGNQVLVRHREWGFTAYCCLGRCEVSARCCYLQCHTVLGLCCSASQCGIIFIGSQ